MGIVGASAVAAAAVIGVIVWHNAGGGAIPGVVSRVLCEGRSHMTSVDASKVAKMQKTLGDEKKKLLGLRKQSDSLRGHRSESNQRALDKRVADQEKKVLKLESDLLKLQSRM